MSVEFRQRKPAEYLQILWKRKWMIVLPAIAISFAIALVVWRLPSLYQSSSLLIVRPPTISGVFVQSLSEADMAARINVITPEVLSRSSVQPLIERYNLYAAERQRGTPMEALVERMQTRDTQIQVSQGNAEYPNAFTVSYKGSEPRVVQAVTAEIARKFVDAQIKAAGTSGTMTKQFFEERLREVKAELDALDNRRIQFMQQNIGQLPSEGDSIATRLGGLYEQQKSYNTEIGRMRDQLNELRNRRGELDRQRQQEIDEVANAVGDPKNKPEYLALAARRSGLNAELQRMLTTLKEKNPDVIAKRAEIADVQANMEQLLASTNAQIEEKRRTLTSRVDTRVSQLESSIQLYTSELARQQSLLGQTNAQISDLERRINGVPGAQVALEAMERDYNTKKALYDGLLQQQEKAITSATVEINQQGQTLAVVDPANLPTRPVAPNRPLLVGVGLALGLGIGLLLAAALEVPRLLTIQTTEDAEHYTSLPVLVAVPELLSAREKRRLKVRHAMMVAAGIAVTILSIPALALALRYTHIFDQFAV
ncbi:MAG: GNVR domain-containing protein [Pyrinomonadaceae bacterium]